MYLDINRKVSMPFVHLKNNIVIKLSNEFEKLIGYSKEELSGKSLEYINKILKINKQVCLENIEGCCEVFIFTKENEPLEVLIHKKALSENELIYFFKETPNSSMKDRFQYVGSMLSNNKTGTAILSFPDLILLKSNQQLFDSIIPPSIHINNSFGLSIKEILPMEYRKSIFEQIIMQITENKEPYFCEEMKILNCNNETKYFDVSFVPIFVSEKIKYIVHTLKDVTEKIVSSNIIKEQKDELEAIIENIHDGLYTVDKDFYITKLNKKINEVVYNPDSIVKTGDSLKYTKYYDFEGNPLELGDFNEYKILNGEKIKEQKFIAHRPDGIFYFSGSGSPIHDKNGNIKKALISIRNITDQVKKDQIIKAQKYELEAIIENMNDEVIIFNKDGKCINMNKKAREIHSIDDKTNINIEDINTYIYYEMDGSVISFDNLTISKLINGEKIENKRAFRKINNNVQYISITGTPIYDFQNNFICGVSVIRDISEIIKYEESLYNKAQYDSLSNIIENLDLGFFRYKYPELEIIDINKKGYFLVKQIIPNIGSHSSLIGKNINNIIFNHNIIDLIHNASKNKSKSYNETVKYNIDNKEIFQKYIFHPVMGMNNEIIEVILIGIDITEEIKAKTELENALKIQDEVYTNVAHELKTPLNVIFSANQIMELFLKNDLTGTNKLKLFDYSKSIKQNCYRLTKLINNIVDLSKSKLGFLKLNLSNQNIVEVIENIVESVTEYAKSNNLNIIFDTTIEEKIMACDPMMLERVMLNLLSNAIKFSKPNENIYVNVTDKGNIIEISVEDTGIGIDKKHLSLIFDKYYQADKSLTRYAEGSGIGLCLSQVIAEMHGGKISVESELDKGSVFKLELPVKTVENPSFNGRVNMSNKIEMINIEFSDIYS